MRPHDPSVLCLYIVLSADYKHYIAYLTYLDSDVFQCRIEFKKSITWPMNDNDSYSLIVFFVAERLHTDSEHWLRQAIEK